MSYWATDLYLNLNQDTKYEQSVDLTCHLTDPLSVDSAIEDWYLYSAPDWVSIDFSTFTLTMNTPLVTKDTHFRFRVRTTDSAESTYRGFLLTVIG